MKVLTMKTMTASLLILFCALAIESLHESLHADEPSAAGDASAGDTAAEQLTPEAQRIVEELRASLDKESEAAAMLDDILQGSNLGPEDGWFRLAKAQSRFDWSYASKRYDADADEAIQASEFKGSEQDFGRLDRNKDGVVTDADFDWTEHSLTPTPGLMMFFMSDRDANGKVTKEEFLQLFSQLASGEDSYLAIDDVRDQFVPAKSRSNDKRPDQPSASTLVMGLKNQEIGSLQSGPNLGELAPDFTLSDLDGNEVALTKQIGNKPTVLVFGNFTCGPFRSQSGNIEKLYARYKDRANFYLIYVREAHPNDGWWMLSNQRAGIDLAQPKDWNERRSIAATCRNRLELNLPFLVDTLDDHVGALYSGMPNRLYLINQQGRIAFKNGRGPFGFHPRQLEQALVLLLNEPAQ
jgi:hypothetical protein